MTDTRREAMERLLDRFDFERVKRTMFALGWQWWDGWGGYPSEARMRKSIWESYESATKAMDEEHDSYEVSTRSGGFCVSVHEAYIGLSFEVEQDSEEYEQYDVEAG